MIFRRLFLLSAIVGCTLARRGVAAEWQFENWEVVASSSGQTRRPAPIRNLVRAGDGAILGTRSSGGTIELWRSTNQGKDWTRGANIATSTTVEFGDPTLFTLPSGELLAGFRERHPTLGWSVRVSRSVNNGSSWSFGGTVQDWTGTPGEFVGAPQFVQLSSGALQVYYDSELAASGGNQYIALKTGAYNSVAAQWQWSNERVVNTSSVGSAGVRDGLATVVNLGPDLDGIGDRLMVVTEGVGTRAGQGHNNIRAFQVQNGGASQADWNTLLDSRVIYQSPALDTAGHRYNAYSPYALRVAGGPVVVAFSTDEVLDNFGIVADQAFAPVNERHSEIKLIHTLNNFETWSSPLTVFGLDHANFTGSVTSGDIFNYGFGMIELAPNDLLATLDLFGGSQLVFRPSLLLQGDYNRNGVVDAADYTLYRETIGSTTQLAADGNNDGAIGVADYNVWRQNFGAMTASAASAIPEPATFIIVLIAGATVRSTGPKSRARKSG